MPPIAGVVPPASAAPASLPTAGATGVKSVINGDTRAGHGVTVANPGALRKPPAPPELPPPAPPPTPPLDVPAALVPAPPRGEPALPPAPTGSTSSVTQPTAPKQQSEAHRPAPIGKRDRLDFMVVLLSCARCRASIGVALPAGK